MSRVAELDVVTEGLLDHQLGAVRQPRRTQPLGQGGERGGRHGEVEEALGALGRRPERPEVPIRLRSRRSGGEPRRLGEASGLEAAAREAPDRLLGVGAEARVVPVQRGHPDDIAVLGEQTLDLEVVEGGQELPGREVAGRPDHDDVLVGGAAKRHELITPGARALPPASGANGGERCRVDAENTVGRGHKAGLYGRWAPGAVEAGSRPSRHRVPGDCVPPLAL